MADSQLILELLFCLAYLIGNSSVLNKESNTGNGCFVDRRKE